MSKVEKNKNDGNSVEPTLEELKQLSQDELAQKVVDLHASLEKATKEFVAVIDDLKAENEVLKKGVSASKDVVVTYKKKKFKVLNPRVRVGKSIINASELEEYPDAIASILEIEGQNILQEVN